MQCLVYHLVSNNTNASNQHYLDHRRLELQKPF
jgi:hypothetical protein